MERAQLSEHRRPLVLVPDLLTIAKQSRRCAAPGGLRSRTRNAVVPGRWSCQTPVVNSSAEDDLLIRSWLECREELGVDLEAPSEYPPGSGQRCVTRLRWFGSPNGMVVVRLQDPAHVEAYRQARQDGLYCSAINPAAYQPFNRDLFVETLDDWGWYGLPEDQPEWYRASGPWVS